MQSQSKTNKRLAPQRRSAVLARRRQLFFALLFAATVVLAAPGKISAALELSLTEPLKVRWHYRTTQTMVLSPAAHQESVYLPLAGGSLVAVAAETGRLIWKAEIGGEISAAPLADARGVFVATETGVAETSGKAPSLAAAGTVRALSRESGVTLWLRTLNRPLRGAFAHTENVLFAGSADGRIYALDKATGNSLWSKNYLTTSFNSQPVIVKTTLFIGNEDGSVLAIDIRNGNTLWRYRTRGAVRGSIVSREGVVCFGSADGKVYAADATTGRILWNKRTGAGVQSLAGSDDALLVASLDNFVYLLNLRRGTQIWKRQLPGRITSQPLVHATNVVLTSLSSDAAVVLNLANGAQLNAVPLQEDDAAGAGPIVSQNLLLITTRQGLLAFSGGDAPRAQ